MGVGSTTNVDSGEAGPDAYRVVDEAGNEVLFRSPEPLVGGVSEGAGEQLYLWEEGGPQGPQGTVYLISGGQEGFGVGAFGMSASGQDIFFTSPEALLPETAPGVYALYDARVDGGFLPKPTPPRCSGEECQGAPAAQPGEGYAASETYTAGSQVQTHLRYVQRAKKARHGRRRKAGKRSLTALRKKR